MPHLQRILRILLCTALVCGVISAPAFHTTGHSEHYDHKRNTISGKVGGSPAGLGVPPEPGEQQLTSTYDADNRLQTSTRGDGTSVQVVYDGDGNKVRETVNGQTISYLVDTQNLTGYAQVLEELQNGTVIRIYTYGHDLLVQDQREATGTWSATWYGYDGHGSVRLLTDGAGQITDRYDYDAFGVLLAASGATYNRYRYCGEQYDDALGLYYLRARFMNAADGRFWSMDTFLGVRSEPLSLHRYIYAHGNSVNGRDPSGYAVEFDDLLNGSIVHLQIGTDFTRQKPEPYFSFLDGQIIPRRIHNFYPISGVLNRHHKLRPGDLGYGIRIALDAAFNLFLRPDLVDLETKEVWEIKPFWRLPEGEAQLMEYLMILNEFSELGDKRWTPGTPASYNPPPSVPGFMKISNAVSYVPMGLIGYSPFTEDTVAILVKSAALATAGEMMLRTASGAQAIKWASVQTTQGTAMMARR